MLPFRCINHARFLNVQKMLKHQNYFSWFPRLKLARWALARKLWFPSSSFITMTLDKPKPNFSGLSPIQAKAALERHIKIILNEIENANFSFLIQHFFFCTNVFQNWIQNLWLKPNQPRFKWISTNLKNTTLIILPTWWSSYSGEKSKSKPSFSLKSF